MSLLAHSLDHLALFFGLQISLYGHLSIVQMSLQILLEECLSGQDLQILIAAHADVLLGACNQLAGQLNLSNGSACCVRLTATQLLTMQVERIGSGRRNWRGTGRGLLCSRLLLRRLLLLPSLLRLLLLLLWVAHLDCV